MIHLIYIISCFFPKMNTTQDVITYKQQAIINLDKKLNDLTMIQTSFTYMMESLDKEFNLESLNFSVDEQMNWLNAMEDSVQNQLNLLTAQKIALLDEITRLLFNTQ